MLNKQKSMLNFHYLFFKRPKQFIGGAQICFRANRTISIKRAKIDAILVNKKQIDLTTFAYLIEAETIKNLL